MTAATTRFFAFALSIVSSALLAGNVLACEPVYIENRCGETIDVLIEHSPGLKNWRINGWYTVEPDEKSRLNVDGDPMCHRRDHSLYFYAESTSGKRVWEGSDSHGEFEGVEYDLRKAIRQNYRGGSLLIITCTN